MELPEVELPLFVFPHGLKLIESKEGFFPLPVFFTLIFTDPKGEQYYAACLQFYEVVPMTELTAVAELVFAMQSSADVHNVTDEAEIAMDAPSYPVLSNSNERAKLEKSTSEIKLPDDGTIVYAPKVLCVLSKMPFYRYFFFLLVIC